LPSQSCTGKGLPREGVLAMDNKMDIVFFDELGFGWLMDEDTLRKMREKESIEELLIQRSLAELFRKREPL
jgi:hypothetical protein